MPGFIKTPKDEARWEKAKAAAGKSTKKDSDSYWALSNYIYHNMGKSEEDQHLTELAKAGFAQLPKLPKLGGPSIKPAAGGAKMPDPMKVGQQATVKMPKAKKPADPFGKPSLFFKAEEIAPKRTSIQKLRDFLVSRSSKKQAKQ